MDLYLVRHAFAAHSDHERWPDDSQRPVTDEGRARFLQVARGLGRVVPSVELVLSSPYVRAWQTAEILHDEIGWPAPQPAEELAVSPPEAAVELLQHPDADSSVALVGHEPHLSLLASLLLTGRSSAAEIELKKGGVICLRVSNPVAVGAATLRWSATPKLLRGLDRGAGR